MGEAESERILGEVQSCLKLMPEELDWYYGAESRMKGIQIVEDGMDLAEFRRRIHMENDNQIMQLEDDYKKLCQEKQQAMDDEKADLEERIDKDAKALDITLMAKLKTLEGSKRTKARTLASDSKGADNETRRKLHASYKGEIDALVEEYEKMKQE